MGATVGVTLLFAMAGWTILSIAVMVYLVGRPRSDRQQNFVILAWVVSSVIVGSFFVFVVSPFSPIGTPILVDKVSIENFDFMITQIFTPSTEPYEVSFYYRKNGGPWYEYYVDHEAWYWRGEIKVDHDTHSLKIFDHGRLRARFDWRTLHFDDVQYDRHSIGPLWVLVSGHPLDAEDSKRRVDVEDLIL